MHKRIGKTSRTRRERGAKGHRFEHWQIDNQVYFITARCRDRYPAFRTDQAKTIVLDRIEHHAKSQGIELWIISVVDNHYHLIAYVATGAALPRFVRRAHGAIAKLVNDLLPQRRAEFWRNERGKEYFDGALRDGGQLRSAWGYTLIQPRRHGLIGAEEDVRGYRFTREYRGMEESVRWAKGEGALLEGVRYPRYEREGRN